MKQKCIEVGIKRAVNGFIVRITAKESIFGEMEDHVFSDIETLWKFLSRELKEQMSLLEKSDE